MPKKEQISREATLESLLRAVLHENRVIAGNGMVMKNKCAGCRNTGYMPLRACEAAYAFLDAEEFRKTEVGT